MARASTCLNFPGTTEEACAGYRGVFGADAIGPVHRFGDRPAQPGQPPMREMCRGARRGTFTDRHGINGVINAPCRRPE